MKLNREFGFFENREGKDLFFSSVYPDNFSEIWVFCNPFIEEKVYTQSVYKHFADHLAAEGYAVIRFDYYGDGDSEGSLNDVDLISWCNDIIDTCNFATKKYKSDTINLFGLRLGASLGLFASESVQVNQLLMWEPVTNGEDYLNELLRLNLTAQLARYGKVLHERPALLEKIDIGEPVNIIGYDIHKSLASSLLMIDLADFPIPKFKVNIVCVSQTGKPKSNDFLKTYSNSPNVGVSTVKTRPFWFEPRYIDVKQQGLIDASMLMLTNAEQGEKLAWS